MLLRSVAFTLSHVCCAVWKCVGPIAVYERPYDPKRPVVCMDELSKQLTRETRQPIPRSVGSVEKYDTEYERNGTANIFLYIEPLKATFVISVTEQRTKPDWAATI